MTNDWAVGRGCRRVLIVVLLGLLFWAGTARSTMAQKPTREQKVREDKRRVEAEGFWIYNDLAQGFATAKRTGKPLLVVLRCLPCEECVKLDDSLVDQDPIVRPLLEKFVCVRQVSTNGLDLSIFQFDTDQSFACFMLNADGVVYGRFGTRSHRTEWLGDVSLPGLAHSLRAALAAHEKYPANKAAYQSLLPPKPEFASPEQFPGLREKYKSTLNYEGNVVQSCIHCHQIGDAQRDWYRQQRRPIPDHVLFPYPHPKSLGLVIDPQGGARVTEVAADSLAERAGLRVGDELLSASSYPLNSIADLQWAFQQIDARGGTLPLLVRRGEAQMKLTWDLPTGWRQSGDLSWRASTWGLRRMATGGMFLEALSSAERQALGIADGKMALRAQHVGEYGPHAAAKQAGARRDDVVVAFGGRDDLMTETALLRHALNDYQIGDRVAVEMLRAGERVKLTIPLQP
ncbi:MAG: Trx7/PDZ domain-containing (seleno)protein [Planctomycetota bacterium]